MRGAHRRLSGVYPAASQEPVSCRNTRSGPFPASALPVPTPLSASGIPSCALPQTLPREPTEPTTKIGLALSLLRREKPNRTKDKEPPTWFPVSSTQARVHAWEMTVLLRPASLPGLPPPYQVPGSCGQQQTSPSPAFPCTQASELHESLSTLHSEPSWIGV